MGNTPKCRDIFAAEFAEHTKRFGLYARQLYTAESLVERYAVKLSDPNAKLWADIEFRRYSLDVDFHSVSAFDDSSRCCIILWRDVSDKECPFVSTAIIRYRMYDHGTLVYA